MQISIQPSLKINAFTRPRVRNSGEFIVGLEVFHGNVIQSIKSAQIENFHGNSPVVIRQVASISPCWKVEYLGAASEDFSETLPSKHSYYIYFKVVKFIESVDQSRMPESSVTKAIESLLSGKGVKKIELPEMDLNMTPLAKVRLF